MCPMMDYLPPTIKLSLVKLLDIYGLRLLPAAAPEQQSLLSCSKVSPALAHLWMIQVPPAMNNLVRELHLFQSSSQIPQLMLINTIWCTFVDWCVDWHVLKVEVTFGTQQRSVWILGHYSYTHTLSVAQTICWMTWITNNQDEHLNTPGA